LSRKSLNQRRQNKIPSKVTDGVFDGHAGEEGVVFGVAADIEDVDGRVRSACHLLGENFEFIVK
jgi:hypothetical protein